MANERGRSRAMPNWKSGGTISIDGVLYMSVGMDRYVDPDFGGRQTRINASVINPGPWVCTGTAPDAGKPSAPDVSWYEFATPFFIHYGKEYAAAKPGQC